MTTDNNPHAIIQKLSTGSVFVEYLCWYNWGCLFISIIPQRLNGVVYLNFLSENLPTLVDDVLLQIRHNMWFIHDGAPAHFSNNVRNHLNRTFPNKWIGCGGPIRWPARSPDLNPLDYFLWDHLQTLVNYSPVDTMEELRVIIMNAINRIRQTPGMFEWIR